MDRFSRFLCQRADDFVILRRAPVKVRSVFVFLRCCGPFDKVSLFLLFLTVKCHVFPQTAFLCYKTWFTYSLQGYDLSFLITNFHTEGLKKNKLIDFIIHFMEEVYLFCVFVCSAGSCFACVSGEL